MRSRRVASCYVDSDADGDMIWMWGMNKCTNKPRWIGGEQVDGKHLMEKQSKKEDAPITEW